MAQPARLLFVFVVALALARPAVAQGDPAARPVPVLDNVDLMDLMVKPHESCSRRVAGGSESLGRAGRPLAEVEKRSFPDARGGQTPECAGGARATGVRQIWPRQRLLGLRNARPADFDGVRGRFPSVAEACTSCHRAFAREAPVIKPSR